MNYFSVGMKIAISSFWFFCLYGLLWIPTLSSLWQEEKVINLFIWTATIDPVIIKNFEQETGIKVNITYFDGNEELFMKLYAAKGEGYDLYMPSDYIMDKLIEYNLAKSLDKSKLDFWDRLNPRLLNHFFDPGNVYSIPYYWAIYGIGIDKEFFGGKLPPASWSLLFTYPIAPAKVAMIDISREAMLMAAQYLFGSIENLTPEKIEQIKKLLIQQKSRVEAYIDTDIRSNYLLTSKGSPVVIAVSPFITKIMNEQSNIDFLIPQEGSFIIIDNLVISVACKKDDLVYQFINFLYRPENLRYHFNEYPFIPVTNDLRDMMEKAGTPQPIIDAHFDETLSLQFFKPVIPEKIANDVWIAVKTS